MNENTPRGATRDDTVSSLFDANTETCLLIVVSRYSKFVDWLDVVSGLPVSLNFESSSVNEDAVVLLIVRKLVRWLRNLGNEVGRIIIVVPFIGSMLKIPVSNGEGDFESKFSVTEKSV